MLFSHNEKGNQKQLLVTCEFYDPTSRKEMINHLNSQPLNSDVFCSRPNEGEVRPPLLDFRLTRC